MTKFSCDVWRKQLCSMMSLVALISVFLESPSVLANTVKHSVVKHKKVAKVTSQRVAYTFASSVAPGTVSRLRAKNGTPSFGQSAGMHSVHDSLSLKSSVALVVDQETNEVLFKKNEQAVLPIASLTKLMTGLIISEANLPEDEKIAITQEDVDTEKGSSSRLRVGAVLSRGELLHLALMSSENRAAHALGRTYPGGLPTFVNLMNSKAQMLGMKDTRYVEPTGLSSINRSSAMDLVKLVDEAHKHPLLRELTTSPGFQVAVGNRVLQYNNTNRLVKNSSWEIGLQKTGYIAEAGRCLVMQTKIAGRQLIMVFLDSAGALTRIADAQRVRQWIESSNRAPAVVSQSAVHLTDRQVALHQL